MALHDTLDTTMYHLRIGSVTGHVSIVPLGITPVDTALFTEYGDSSKLPEWVQRKLAVLMVLGVDPTIEVHGVGRRVSDNTFWVYQ